jgi:hypothetical protein
MASSLAAASSAALRGGPSLAVRSRTRRTPLRRGANAAVVANAAAAAAVAAPPGTAPPVAVASTIAFERPNEYGYFPSAVAAAVGG